MEKKKQITTNKPIEIWQFLKDNLSKTCYDELCWLNDKTFNANMNKDICHFAITKKKTGSLGIRVPMHRTARGVPRPRAVQ
jgi:hypothetical protein